MKTIFVMETKRKTRFARAIMVAAVATCFPQTIANAAAPNVLFIAVDDLNDWVNCMGGREG
ncbi:MAG: hypothetical protein OSA84_11880, partial [Akkermansiaceae bacterium]|nr:hypothetical protein [Akkermansiaceae bacterium]